MNGCWGIDARISSLATNATAQARWVLPITAAGSYNTFVRVPAVTNAAGQVRFNLLAGGANVLSVFFADPLPASQWVYLARPSLNPGVTNVLEMVVSAQGQTNQVAVADVVKLSPLIFTTAPPRLRCQFSGATLTLYWNGTGLALQQATCLGPGSANWTDLAGPITVSPYTLHRHEHRLFPAQQIAVKCFACRSALRWSASESAAPRKARDRRRARGCRIGP